MPGNGCAVIGGMGVFMSVMMTVMAVVIMVMGMGAMLCASLYHHALRILSQLRYISIEMQMDRDILLPGLIHLLCTASLYHDVSLRKHNSSLLYTIASMKINR